MTDATNKQRQAAFRKKKREDGLQEVRGIFAPQELHEAIKEAAKQIFQRRGGVEMPNKILTPKEVAKDVADILTSVAAESGVSVIDLLDGFSKSMGGPGVIKKKQSSLDGDKKTVFNNRRDTAP